MRALWVPFFLIAITGCWPGEAADRQFVASARSIDVIDGDSLVIKQGRNEREVRLYGIDAPEHRQPWSREARNALSKMVTGYDLRIEPVETDRYERTVARVYRVDDNLPVNAELVSGGHAWVYRKYTRDKDLLHREQLARNARAGLWQLPVSQRKPPWDWRGEPRREP